MNNLGNSQQSALVVLDLAPVYQDALMILDISMRSRQQRFDGDAVVREQLDFMVGTIINSLAFKVIDPFQSREDHYKEIDDLSLSVSDLFHSHDTAVRFCMKLQSEILQQLVASFPYIDSFKIVDITARGQVWYILLSPQNRVIQQGTY